MIPPPKPGESRWGMSLIFRPTTEKLTSKLVQITKELVPYTGKGQLIYQPQTFHTTVRSIEPYREIDTLITDTKFALYIEALQSALTATDTKPFVISYKGLTAHNSSIMAQGWPQKESLQILRESFMRELAKRNLNEGLEATTLRTTAHTTLLVITKEVKNPLGLVQYLRKNRNIEIDGALVRQLEICSYARSLSGVAIKTLATFDLETSLLVINN